MGVAPFPRPEATEQKHEQEAMGGRTAPARTEPGGRRDCTWAPRRVNGGGNGWTKTEKRWKQRLCERTVRARGKSRLGGEFLEDSWRW